MTDLKPCPFCGGKAELYTQRVIGGIDYVHIICKTCRVSTVDYEASTSYCANDKAIEDWNRRAETVKDQPSADVAEVVRCKDCKYLMFSDCYGECRRNHLGIVRSDDFCSYGERKEGDENG